MENEVINKKNAASPGKEYKQSVPKYNYKQPMTESNNFLSNKTLNQYVPSINFTNGNSYVPASQSKVIP